MASFDWREFERRSLPERYPDATWILGRQAWRERTTGSAPDLSGLVSDLAALRQAARWGAPPLACPRVFISHRRDDRDDALAMARLAAQSGFQFWLDVLDPTLQGAALPSIAIAAVIEMALLNCTHVVAIMTLNTHGGMWVPYEYGRVKLPALTSPQAATWLHPDFATAAAAGTVTLPEYLLLGDRLSTRMDVRYWFDREMGAWNAKFRTCPGGAGDSPPVAGDLPEPASA
jgi:hypothetical protein